MPNLIHCMKGRWGDRILLLLLLFGMATLWQWVNHMVSSGPPTAYIYHNDILLARYPLDQNKPIRMQAEGDIGISEIVIDTAGVRIESSPCSSQFCVLSGNHHRAGDMAACVPNRILVSIRGSQKEPQLDGISQ
ncbi:MAG: NusG domain II-containing protein [Mariprofundaceae bacterium]